MTLPSSVSGASFAAVRPAPGPRHHRQRTTNDTDGSGVRFVKSSASTGVGGRVGVTVSALLVVALLSGCAGVSAVVPTVPSPPGSKFGHIHGVGVDEGSGVVYIATHEGLFSVSSSLGSPRDPASLGSPIAGLRQDNMGFVIDGGRMYASGHPDPTVSSEANLGLVTSTDQGKRWSSVSLKGTADFHDLEVSRSSPGATIIYGFDSAEAVIRVSRDGGSTWTSGATLEMRDFAADRALAGTIYATTSAGLKVSHDYAASFEISPDAPALYLIASAGSTSRSQLVGIDVSGVVWKKSADSPWQSTGAVTGRADALAFSVGVTPMLVVADQRGIVASSDFGATWRILVRS